MTVVYNWQCTYQARRETASVNEQIRTCCIRGWIYLVYINLFYKSEKFIWWHPTSLCPVLEVNIKVAGMTFGRRHCARIPGTNATSATKAEEKKQYKIIQNKICLLSWKNATYEKEFWIMSEVELLKFNELDMWCVNGDNIVVHARIITGISMQKLLRIFGSKIRDGVLQRIPKFLGEIWS